MSTGWIIVIIVMAVLIGGIVALYFVGKKMQKRQEESERQMHEGAQLVSMLVIEKKKQKLKEAGLPQIVIDQTPKYLRNTKLPTVKAKIGPRVVTMVADEKAYGLIPEKREVKCLINGIYIIEAKSARGGLETPPVKKSFGQKLKDKAADLKKKTETEETTQKKKKK